MVSDRSQKQLALDRLLQSRTLARSEQLRAFLKFVCEMEMSGRAAEISEHAIGITALGKGQDFSPTEDSSVRNRAHALRGKLEEYYRDEAPGAAVRIEFPKGTYVPQFLETPATPVAVPAPVVEPERATEPRLVRAWLAPFAAGLALAAVAAALWPRAEVSRVDPVLREAWGPLLSREANVLLCLVSPAHLTVHPYNRGAEKDRLTAPAGVAEWYRQRHPLDPKSALFLHPNDNHPAFGDVYAAMVSLRVLAGAGVSHEILPERIVSAPELRKRNAMIFGAAVSSPVLRYVYQHGGDFAFEHRFDAALSDFVIATRKPAGQGGAGQGGKVFQPEYDDRKSRVDSYALITVLPAEGGRTVIMTGDRSAGVAAAAEYFASPAMMADLRRRFMTQGRGGFPDTYQVVVRGRTQENLPLNYEYVAHWAASPPR